MARRQTRKQRAAEESRRNEARKQAQAAERELHAHFAGQRTARRVDTLVECRIAGGRGHFRGIAVDLSSTGALVRITDPHFAGTENEEALMQFSFRVGTHFGDGVQLIFLGGTFPVVGDVVRVTSRIEEETQSRSHLMGVRFHEELTDRECRAIGIEATVDDPMAEYTDAGD